MVLTTGGIAVLRVSCRSSVGPNRSKSSPATLSGVKKKKGPPPARRVAGPAIRPPNREIENLTPPSPNAAGTSIRTEQLSAALETAMRHRQYPGEQCRFSSLGDLRRCYEQLATVTPLQLEQAFLSRATSFLHHAVGGISG